MKSAILGLVVLGATFLSIGLFNQKTKISTSGVDVQTLSAMKEWMVTHKKVYSTPQEESFRAKVFAKNLQEIKLVNTGNTDYQFGLNQFSDLTKEEFRAKYLKASPLPELEEFVPEETGLSQVQTVDWAAKLGAPVSQTGRSGCYDSYAFAASDAINYANVIQRGVRNFVSPQEFIDCSANFGNRGCGGGNYSGAFEYAFNYGVAFLNRYPYSGAQGQCRGVSNTNKIAKYLSVASGNEDQLKRALNTQPLAVTINFDFLQSYRSGVYRGLCEGAPNHQLLLVGYGVSGEGAYWKLQNHWGAGYGERGFLRIDASTYNKCQVTTSAVAVQMA